MVALTGGPEGDTLVRRAARIAARTKGADLLAVHVTSADGLTGADPANLARQRALVESLGGTYHQVVGDDVPRALLDFARGVNATQLVLGASRRGRFAQLFSRGVGVDDDRAVRLHRRPHGHPRARPARDVGRRRSRAALTRTRRLAGWALAVLGHARCSPPLLIPFRDVLSLPSEILFFLLTVVGVALVGGMWPALSPPRSAARCCSTASSPRRSTRSPSPSRRTSSRWSSSSLVAAAVSAIVDLAARRTREAARASADAEVLSTLAGHVLRGEAAVPSLLERLRETFGLTSVTLLERRAGRAAAPTTSRTPRPGGSSPPRAARPCTCPGHGRHRRGRSTTTWSLAAAGQAAGRRPTGGCWRRSPPRPPWRCARSAWRQEAEQARPLAEADKMRTALLAAVSHDLRTPLASAKAAVESLRSTDIDWSATRTAPSCSPPPTSRWTSSTGWSPTCST